MTCRDLDDLFLSDAGRSPGASEHLQGCERCRALYGQTNAPLDPELLARIRQSLPATLTPVKPLPPVWVFAVVFLAVFAYALLPAKLAGMYGVHTLSPMQAGLIFAVLAGTALLGTITATRDLRPASGALRGSAVLLIGLVAVQVVFFAMLPDTPTAAYVPRGLGCLTFGIGCAMPALLAMIWIMRAGYVTAPISTGVTIGTLAGLTGLFTLELHCPLLGLSHVAVWHTAVVVVMALLGGGAGWLAPRLFHSQKPA